MTKRLVTVALWSFCGLYAGAYLAFLAGASPAFGQTAGLIVGLLIGTDLRGYLIARGSGSPLAESRISNTFYPASISAIPRPEGRQPG